MLKFSILKYEENIQDHEQKSYGWFTTTLKIIEENQYEKFYLYDKLGQITENYIIISDINIEKKPNIMEYMKSEWYINMSVAIDYTLSNGKPSDSQSLHYLDEVNVNLKLFQFLTPKLF